RLPPPQRVLALKRGHRLNCMGAADGLRSGFGKAEVLHLACLDQILNGSGYFFDRHVQIDTMLVEQIDRIDTESLERRLSDLLDVLGPAIQGAPPVAIAGVRLPAELGCDHYLPVEWSESFAHEFLVRERTVDLGSIEERDAALHGGLEKRDHVPLVFGRAVRPAHSHAAQPDGRDFQGAVSKFALLHSVSSLGLKSAEAVSRSSGVLAYSSGRSRKWCCIRRRDAIVD